MTLREVAQMPISGEYMVMQGKKVLFASEWATTRFPEYYDFQNFCWDDAPELASLEVESIEAKAVCNNYFFRPVSVLVITVKEN